MIENLELRRNSWFPPQRWAAFGCYRGDVVLTFGWTRKRAKRSLEELVELMSLGIL